MDFSVWSQLEKRIQQMPHHTVERLKQYVLVAWDQLDEAYLRSVIEGVPRRLRACIRAKGDVFEK